MKLFRNRWWVVFGSAIGLMVSGGPINIFTFGVFLRAVTEDIHIGRGAFASRSRRLRCRQPRRSCMRIR